MAAIFGAFKAQAGSVGKTLIKNHQAPCQSYGYTIKNLSLI